VCRRHGWTLGEETSRVRSDINESASRKTYAQYAQRGASAGTWRTRAAATLKPAPRPSTC
jgi:hypothetical protein